MSDVEVAVVERFRAAVNTGDEQTAVSMLAPDVEFGQPGRTMRGIDEVRAGYLKAGAPPRQLENLDMDFDPCELEDMGGGQVGATNHQVFSWKESGELAYERRARIAYTIRDGKIVRYEATMLEDEAGS